MKIIHCADLHLGAPIKNLSPDLSKIRKREMIDTFINMVDYAKNNDVSIIIIAGDLFDTHKTQKSIHKEILNVITDTPNIDFIYLTGNHDESTDFLSEEVSINLKSLNCDTEWTKYTYDEITISLIDIFKQKTDLFYNKLDLNEKDYNIVVLHGDQNEIKFDKLSNKGVDYLALGHIHIPDEKPKKLGSRGVYAYSGSLDAHGFDELGPRGFILLDINQGILKSSFHPISKREYLNVEVDITNCNDHNVIYNEIKKTIANIDTKNLITVNLKGKYKVNTQKDIQGLESKLNELFFFARIKDNSTLDLDTVEFKGEISLRHEFVKKVKESDLPNEQKEKIIEYGIKALEGEDIEI